MRHKYCSRIICNCKLQENMPSRVHLTPNTASRAVGLLQGGFTQRNVAQRFGVSQKAILNLARRFANTGFVTRKPGTGPKRKTTAAQDRYITLGALRKRVVTAPALAQDLRHATGVAVSAQIV